jgi:hypothetical protein
LKKKRKKEKKGKWTGYVGSNSKKVKIREQMVGKKQVSFLGK